jgi:hypothetical protein
LYLLRETALRGSIDSADLQLFDAVEPSPSPSSGLSLFAPLTKSFLTDSGIPMPYARYDPGAIPDMKVMPGVLLRQMIGAHTTINLYGMPLCT